MRGYRRDILFQLNTVVFKAKLVMGLKQKFKLAWQSYEEELNSGKNRFLIQTVTQERIDLLTASSS